MRSFIAKRVVGTMVAGAALAVRESESAPPSTPPLKGLMMQQEPKYKFDGGLVINRASGEMIPLDEPVFVLRGRDYHAVDLLDTYADMINASPYGDTGHLAAVQARVKQFEDFRAQHPDRMKEPDTDTSGPEWLTERTDDEQG